MEFNCFNWNTWCWQYLRGGITNWSKCVGTGLPWFFFQSRFFFHLLGCCYVAHITNFTASVATAFWLLLGMSIYSKSFKKEQACSGWLYTLWAECHSHSQPSVLYTTWSAAYSTFVMDPGRSSAEMKETTLNCNNGKMKTAMNKTHMHVSNTILPRLLFGGV